jgi:hypothetical protein
MNVEERQDVQANVVVSQFQSPADLMCRKKKVAMGEGNHFGP